MSLGDSLVSPQPPDAAAGFRVIGAGLGRTGTTSLDAAMKTLGMTPYHMRDVMGTAGHLDRWIGYMDACKSNNAAAVLAATDAVINALLRDCFTANSDYPACLIYERLMERFPDALVLLGVRTSGKAWAESMMQTIGLAPESMAGYPFASCPSCAR